MPTFKESVNAKVTELEDRLLDIEIKFFSTHTNPLESPDAYALDVQSYAVLCHAAFEDFAESICVMMMDHIENCMTSKLEYSKATLCFLHFDFGLPALCVDKWNQGDKLFNYITKQIRERKSKLSEYAMIRNHGVNIKYLQSLFLPIGLELPAGNARNSLNRLADIRGFYAHAFSPTRPNAVNIVAPQTTVDYVMDVLEYMKDVASKATTMKYYKW